MSAWEAVSTEDGRAYYWNHTTDEVSWKCPAEWLLLDGVAVDGVAVDGVASPHFGKAPSTQVEAMCTIIQAKALEWCAATSIQHATFSAFARWLRVADAMANEMGETGVQLLKPERAVSFMPPSMPPSPPPRKKLVVLGKGKTQRVMNVQRARMDQERVTADDEQQRILVAGRLLATKAALEAERRQRASVEEELASLREKMDICMIHGSGGHRYLNMERTLDWERSLRVAAEEKLEALRQEQAALVDASTEAQRAAISDRRRRATAESALKSALTTQTIELQAERRKSAAAMRWLAASRAVPKQTEVPEVVVRAEMVEGSCASKKRAQLISREEYDARLSELLQAARKQAAEAIADAASAKQVVTSLEDELSELQVRLACAQGEVEEAKKQVRGLEEAAKVSAQLRAIELAETERLRASRFADANLLTFSDRKGCAYEVGARQESSVDTILLGKGPGSGVEVGMASSHADAEDCQLFVSMLAAAKLEIAERALMQERTVLCNKQKTAEQVPTGMKVDVNPATPCRSSSMLALPRIPAWRSLVKSGSSSLRIGLGSPHKGSPYKLAGEDSL